MKLSKDFSCPVTGALRRRRVKKNEPGRLRKKMSCQKFEYESQAAKKDFGRDDFLSSLCHTSSDSEVWQKQNS